MATQTGLGEPRGPWFISPDLRPERFGPVVVPDPDRDPRRPGQRSRALVAALAVLALSTGAGGLAGGWVAGRADAEAEAASAGLPADLVAAAAQVVPGVVSVTVDAGSQTANGSGFALDDQHHVVTNDHIVAKAADGSRGGDLLVLVETPDGRQFDAQVVGREPASDIAVLRVSRDAGLTALPLAKPGATRVGEPVLAVGSPLGLPGTVTAGIVSALDREVRLGNNRHTAVQTDASINPGNSGGPLVNARGEVVGVNTAIATIDGNGSIGIGFAIPIEQVQQVADTIIGKGG
nr:trypsin-like peptidase domain-containing protein [Micromonospora sp. DSM 115978]